MLITVILETIIFESYEGKTDDLIYQAAAKTPQLSKHARSLQHFTNYRGPEAGVLLENVKTAIIILLCLQIAQHGLSESADSFMWI